MLVRSLLFNKTLDNNWPVAWHQDVTVSLAKERDSEQFGPWSRKDGSLHAHAPVGLLESMITLRLHLDPVSEKNGALRVVPASHRRGKWPPEELRAMKEHFQAQQRSQNGPKGSILVMKPLLVHASNRTVTGEQRRVLHLEFAPSRALPEGFRWGEQSV